MTSARLPPVPNAVAAPPDLGAVRAAARRCGVGLRDDDYGAQSYVESAAPATGAVLAGGALAWLPGQSVLRVAGDDADRFLHSQTTNDVLQHPPDAARWHGYCSPKGRLLATMLAWRDDASIRLLLPDSVAEPIRKRLTMFVLRAKVRISNESDAFVVLGLIGTAGAAALARLQVPAPAPMRVAAAASALTAIGLPALPAHALDEASDEVPRWLLVAPLASVESAWNELRATLTPIDSSAWRWTDVRSGIASIVTATSEQFVPQMLNLEADAIGAVSFTKGCYPGQEVVARSHYLGKTKRRAFVARIAVQDDARQPAPGSDVVDAAGQPVGKVVVAAPSPDHAIDVLYEAQVAAVQRGELAVDGQALRPLALPYPLPAE